ncbi:MAG: response regulator transcription factor [Anaerolineae bacterium]|nr:response regulator transcription factor [Anaerolineae bacterium]
MNNTTILLADDHVLVRQGTRELLERENDLVVVGEAGDGEEAVELAASLHPDVIIMDIAMPKMSGIEATRQIKSMQPDTAVLILSAYDDDQYIFALLEAGAAGYLLKDVPAQELVEAIRAVHAGESILHPAIARKVINRFAAPRQEVPTSIESDQLSDREMGVLKLAAKGMTNMEIANELSLSVRTVQGHLSNIFGKMQVGSRTEAVIQALGKGWFTLEEIQ